MMASLALTIVVGVVVWVAVAVLIGGWVGGLARLNRDSERYAADERRRELRQARMAERRVASALRPRTGLVDVSARRPPNNHKGGTDDER